MVSKKLVTNFPLTNNGGINRALLININKVIIDQYVFPELHGPDNLVDNGRKIVLLKT